MVSYIIGLDGSWAGYLSFFVSFLFFAVTMVATYFLLYCVKCFI